MFIGISGLIGAGKSTLTEQLAEEMDARYRARGTPPFYAWNPDVEVPDDRPYWAPYFEPVRTNPYLADFYKDMARWTFPMQMFLMCKRYQQHQELIWDPTHQRGGGVVQDRTIYEDTIFAKMHYDDGIMDDRDYATYLGQWHVLRRFLQYPDVIVYLRVTPECAHERIKERGREAEQNIPDGYIESLYERYEQFASEMGHYTLVLYQDWTEYRPVQEVADKVEDLINNNRDFLKSVRRV